MLRYLLSCGAQMIHIRGKFILAGNTSNSNLHQMKLDNYCKSLINLTSLLKLSDDFWSDSSNFL